MRSRDLDFITDLLSSPVLSGLATSVDLLKYILPRCSWPIRCKHKSKKSSEFYQNINTNLDVHGLNFNLIYI